MKPYKHVIKHTTKLLRGVSTTYQCAIHVSCQHCYKLIERTIQENLQWALLELNLHTEFPAPKPRGIDPMIRAKVSYFSLYNIYLLQY